MGEIWQSYRIIKICSRTRNKQIKPKKLSAESHNENKMI